MPGKLLSKLFKRKPKPKSKDTNTARNRRKFYRENSGGGITSKQAKSAGVHIAGYGLVKQANAGKARRAVRKLQRAKQDLNARRLKIAAARQKGYERRMERHMRKAKQIEAEIASLRKQLASY